jgi:NAD(P)H-dependent FMN reductase
MESEARPHILVILGSTRQGRFGETVARWLFPIVESREDLTSELVDLRDWKLPYYDRPNVAAASEYDDEQCRAWAEVVGRADGFLIITPEYNFGYPAVLKSALDAVYDEWNRKPVAFAGYGGWSGGTRGVQQLREVAVELQMAPVRGQVVLQFARRLFDEEGNPKNADFYNAAATRMLDDLAWWAVALKNAREETVH